MKTDNQNEKRKRSEQSPNGRRDLFKKVTQVATSLGAFHALSALAQSAELCESNSATPRQPEGPFYPKSRSEGVDADLTEIVGSQNRAKGEVVELLIQVVNASCEPLSDATVDLWQACSSGKYNHPDDRNEAQLDTNFQYQALLKTNSMGQVLVKTIKPGAYPASATWIRPPHIHFKVSAVGFETLTTQMYFGGEALNKTDQILQRLTETEREQLIVSFEKILDNPPKGQFRVQLRPA